MVHSNVINVPVIFVVHMFLFDKCIYDVLFSITLTSVCTCAYLHKFLIKLLLIFSHCFSHCKSNHEIFPLFSPILTAVGNFPLSLAGEKFPTTLLQWEISHCIDGSGKFPTVSIRVRNFPTEVHFVGKSPARSHSG